MVSYLNDNLFNVIPMGIILFCSIPFAHSSLVLSLIILWRSWSPMPYTKIPVILPFITPYVLRDDYLVFTSFFLTSHGILVWYLNPSV